MISNRQKSIPVQVQFLRRFVKQLSSLLRLGHQWFDVTLVDDVEIERLNRTFRGVARPTDVLSFPWRDGRSTEPATLPERKEWSGFLGDVVISVETARRNSVGAGVSLRTEIRQLVLHGALHLLGYDHETDQGEMEALEMNLRQRLRISS